jgi:hypothetical protein
VEEFMTDYHLFFNHALLKELAELWQVARTIENVRLRRLLSNLSTEEWDKTTHILKRYCEDATRMTMKLQICLENELLNLGPRSIGQNDSE